MNSDPLSLAAVLDEEGQSTLLISGSGLSYLTSRQLFEAGSRATIISSDPLYQTASNLTVAQTGPDFALWFRTNDHILGYQRGRGIQLLGSPVPLLPSHSTADFAPLLDPQSKSQSLIVLGEKNDLTLMTQSNDTTTWKALPLMIQQLDQVMKVQAFVTHIEVRDADGMLITQEDYHLSCSGWTRGLINGRETVLSSQPTVVRTSERGVITVIVPAEDITSYVYTLNNAGTTKQAHRLGKSYTVDPSQKVQDRLTTALKEGKHLRDIETPEGKLLDGSARPEDVDAAEELLKQIPGVLEDIKSKSTSSSLYSLDPSDYAALSWISKASEWWEWLKQKAKDVEKWFVQKVKDVWHFVVHIAGEVWAFVLDTVAEVFKGITWLLKKIGAALKKIWDWLSYIFNIEDIKATARSLRTLFDASLIYAEAFVKSGVKPVEDWADGLEAKITQALGVQLPSGIVDQKQRPKDHTTSKLGDVNAAANVTFYYLEQGQHVGGFSFTPSGPISTLYQDIILPILQELQKDIPIILSRLLNLFSDSKGAAIKDVMEIVATVVHALVQSLKKLVVGFIKLGGDLIHMINEVVHTPFSHFPIIGPLLKLFGFDATILDIVIYVLAVPVTIFAKIVTNERPRRIDKIDYQALVEGKITDKDVLMAYTELASFLGITEAFFESLYRVYKMLTAEVPEEPETFSAIGITFDVLIAAVTFPWDRKAPAWDFKVSIWSANLASKIVHAICLKCKAPAQLSAVIEGVVGIVAFCLSQVVHHENLDSPDKVWGDDVLIGFSIGESVFEVIEAVSTTMGVLQPETLPADLSGRPRRRIARPAEVPHCARRSLVLPPSILPQPCLQLRTEIHTTPLVILPLVLRVELLVRHARWARVPDALAEHQID
ncbi:hypothetical protein H0H81_009733 [Sphagnurus paluster]|uniref:Uncharacterized protein n=1 Tax=Sphagnurus paluster TaxID=117069 RepID=A0A9P7GJG5_9AGAR|nr:hypothetical protein H0H81_009733 [Sphagnurus paluster]